MPPPLTLLDDRLKLRAVKYRRQQLVPQCRLPRGQICDRLNLGRLRRCLSEFARRRVALQKRRVYQKRRQPRSRPVSELGAIQKIRSHPRTANAPERGGLELNL